MKIPLIFLFLLTVSQLTAQQEVAEISFETDNIDYGEITKNSDGERTFIFTNTGNAPLIIENVRSSCGCTVPKRPESPIMPGEKGEITVLYDTSRVGPFRKTITVSSNATSAPMIGLKIKGTVLDQN